MSDLSIKEVSELIVEMASLGKNEINSPDNINAAKLFKIAEVMDMDFQKGFHTGVETAFEYVRKVGEGILEEFGEE